MTPSELASPDGTHSGRTPSRIVVIDDEQDMRASISQWLSLSGFQPETYASAEEALANLGADFPGIVVTDILYQSLNLLSEVAHGLRGLALRKVIPLPKQK